MRPTKPSIDVCEKYLADTSSDAERAQVEAWAQHAAGVRTRAGVHVEQLARSVEQYAKNTHSTMSRRQAAVGSRWRQWFVPVAASVLGLAGVSVWWTNHDEAKEPALLAGRAYHTGAGQQATIALADGSEIVLAPQTRVIVSPEFARANRLVALEGRALFRVTNHGTPAFEVQTGDVTMRVLGTEFEIATPQESSEVRVAVASGKVSVSGGTVNHAMTLSAGMVGSITDSIATSRVVEDMTPYTAWTTGNLVFRNASAADVLHAVSEWYGVHFQLSDSALVRDRLTVRVSTQSRQAALATLEQHLGVDARIVHDTLVILIPKSKVQTQPTGVRKATPASATPFREVGR